MSLARERNLELRSVSLQRLPACEHGKISGPPAPEEFFPSPLHRRNFNENFRNLIPLMLFNLLASSSSCIWIFFHSLGHPSNTAVFHSKIGTRTSFLSIFSFFLIIYYDYRRNILMFYLNINSYTSLLNFTQDNNVNKKFRGKRDVQNWSIPGQILIQFVISSEERVWCFRFDEVV